MLRASGTLPADAASWRQLSALSPHTWKLRAPMLKSRMQAALRASSGYNARARGCCGKTRAWARKSRARPLGQRVAAFHAPFALDRSRHWPAIAADLLFKSHAAKKRRHVRRLRGQPTTPSRNGRPERKRKLHDRARACVLDCSADRLAHAKAATACTRGLLAQSTLFNALRWFANSACKSMLLLCSTSVALRHATRKI